MNDELIRLASAYVEEQRALQTYEVAKAARYRAQNDARSSTNVNHPRTVVVGGQAVTMTRNGTRPEFDYVVGEVVT